MGNGGTGHRWPGFATDLHNLYKAGRRDLPSVAAAYASSNSHVSRTVGIDRALAGAEPFGGTAGLTAFVQLRDDVQTILGDGSVALNQTGEALCRAAETYAGTDADVEREMKLIGDDLPVVPPPVYPAG
jgi:hypothetical protein